MYPQWIQIQSIHNYVYIHICTHTRPESIVDKKINNFGKNRENDTQT